MKEDKRKEKKNILTVDALGLGVGSVDCNDLPVCLALVKQREGAQDFELWKIGKRVK